MTPHRRDRHHNGPHHAAAGVIADLCDALEQTLQLLLDGLAPAPPPRRVAAQARCDQAPACEHDRRRRAAGWAAAISAALDDEQLATAVARLSPPVPGIGRRSACVARGDLIAWAVAAHRRRPDQPLQHALTAALADTTDAARPGGVPSWPSAGPVAAPDGDLPEPPDVGHAPLHARLVAAVQRLEPAVDAQHGHPR